MLAYRVELYRRRTDEWVPTGPLCFDRERALQLLQITLAPEAWKRLAVLWVGRATEELDTAVPADLDRARLEFCRHLVMTGCLNEGYGPTAGEVARETAATSV